MSCFDVVRGRLDAFTGRGDGVPRRRCSAQVGNSVKRLAGGLSKLVDAARDVDRMSIELKDAQVIVSAKTVEVEALIEQITEKTTIANKCARRVLKCCGGFTPSTRLASRREGAGWSVLRF